MADGQPQSSDQIAPRLSSADELALDALLQSGFDVRRVAPSPLEPRVAALSSMFDAIGRAPEADADGTLVDVTLARIMQDDRRRVAMTAELIPDDEDALDAWVAASQNVARVPQSLRRRAEQIAAIGQAITSVQVQSTSGDLVARTLAKLDATKVVQDPIPISRGSLRDLRLADLVSLAAMLLLGTAVLWPVLSSVRSYADRLNCKSGLASVASSLGVYAGDFRDALPVASAAFAGPWWNVGDPTQSNSANLFTLARSGYSSLDPLACAGNPHAVRGQARGGDMDWGSIEQVSFSYRILGGPTRVTLSSNPSMIVAVDRSPVVLKAIRGEDIFPLENSPNHDGRGQNVLTADGRVTWMCSPLTAESDNIWLPKAIETAIHQATAEIARRQGRAAPIRGVERPETSDDQFVGP